jgi:hypothetical protein
MRILKQLFSAAALVLCWDIAGWASCTSDTPYDPSVSGTGESCNGQACEEVTGGGCSGPIQENVNFLCYNAQTQRSYTKCSFGPSGCTASTEVVNVTYGQPVACPC